MVLKNIAVVLFRPKIPENVGTTARAMANMGLGPLILVDPFYLDRDVMLSAATKAGRGHIENVVIQDDLDAALAEFHLVVGTTARLGSHRGPFYTPRNIAPRVLGMAREYRAALLFGPERTGLTTAELRLCQAVVRIPTADPKTSSLNLAQAVLVLGYEFLLAAEEKKRDRPKVIPAPMSEVRAMYDHLSETLLDIGFLPEQNPDHWLMSFKRLFNRTDLTHGECNLLRGVCRQIKWAIGNRTPKEDPVFPVDPGQKEKKLEQKG